MPEDQTTAQTEEPESLAQQSAEGAASEVDLLRRAVFAEEALELSHWVKDSELLNRLRSVITGRDEAELKEKIGVLKEVIAHIREQESKSRPSQEDLKELVAREVEENIERLNKAARTVDAAVGERRRESGPKGKLSLAAKLRRLTEARGIIIK